MIEPVYDLCNILKALRYNNIAAGVSPDESGFSVFVEDNGQRIETKFNTDKLIYAAGWMKRVCVHLRGKHGIDWDKGKWELRRVGKWDNS